MAVLFICHYASLSAVELNVREEITCKWENHCFLSNKYTPPPPSIIWKVYSLRWIQLDLDLKMDFVFPFANPNPEFDLVSPFQIGFVGFEIQRIQIQINGLVIYTVLCSICDGVRISQLIQWYFLLKCALNLSFRQLLRVVFTPAITSESTCC